MIGKFWRYSQVRIYTGILYITILLFMTEIVGIYYLWSMFTAFVPAYALEFFLNSKWTYKAHSIETS